MREGNDHGEVLFVRGEGTREGMSTSAPGTFKTRRRRVLVHR